LTAWAAATAGELEQVLVPIGLGAVALLAVAMAGRWHDLLPWGISLLAAPYALSLLLREGGIDPFAPVYAGGLLLTTELCYWTMERAPTAGGREIVPARAGSLIGLALAAAGAAVLVLAVSDAGAGGGVALELVGVVAAAAALGLVAWLAWQTRSPNNS
jgi:hypothetical protein